MTILALILVAAMAPGQPEKPKPLPAPPVATQPAEQRQGDPYALSKCAACDAGISESKPYIHVTNGRELRFCCALCEAKFDEDAKKSLAAVDAKMIKDQMPYYPLKTSVVSGAPLPPDKTIDFIYNNRLVRVASESEKGDFAKNPKKYQKLLDEAVIREQGKKYPLEKCPVSGDVMGGQMGDPVDVVVANRLVRLCCSGCKEDLYQDPAKYLAKVKDATPAKP